MNQVMNKYREGFNMQLMSIAQTCITLYIVYQFLYVPLWGGLPLISQLLLYLSLAIVAMDGLKSKRGIQSGFVFFTLFLLYSLITGYFVANDFNTVLTSCETMMYALFTGIVISRVSQWKSSTKWVVSIILFCAISVAVGMIAGLGTQLKSGRITTNEDFNANTLGAIMVFGMWSSFSLTTKFKSNVKNVVITMSIVLALSYIVILTGSRKSLICAVAMILLWVIFALLPKIKHSTITKKITFVFTIVIVIIIAVVFFGSFYTEQSAVILSRMDRISTDSQSWKIGMISDAFRVFLEHPLFGVGLNNYKFYSIYQLYSHCTYAEVFACSGVIGASILFYMIISSLLYNVRTAFRSYKFGGMKNEVEYFILNLVLCVLFYGQILFYSRYLMIMYFVLLANNGINKNNTLLTTIETPSQIEA